MPRGTLNPTDKHVGSRVRMRRLMLDISQTNVADALGLTFQQVQKYEKGSNRIGASRLQHISQILQVPIPLFFEGAPAALGIGPSARETAVSASYVTDFPHSAASNAFGAGGRPHRAGQRRAALHAAMSNVLKIVRRDAVGERRWIDGRDRHPVPAMWTGTVLRPRKTSSDSITTRADPGMGGIATSLW
jgi:transcriptional regulator with XRE-family HTH domain